MIRGAITLALPVVDGDEEVQDRSDRRRLAELDQLPDLTVVTVDIKGRRYLGGAAVHDLHRLGSRMHLTITAGTPEMVAVHVAAARAGCWVAAR